MVIAFATLILGLAVGVQPVDLVVGEDVARVELFVDGELLAEVAEAPWRFGIDFGSELAPHELVAVARDAAGAEIGRARQLVSLPRPPAEATVVVEGEEDGEGVVARVAWESVARREPRKVTATFDGRPLEVVDPRRIELPDHDPEQLHLLRVELEFSSILGAVAEVVFGGGYGNETATELTAVPVEVDGRRRDLEIGSLAGRLVKGNRALTPVAVEEGPAEVVVVMDREAQRVLWEHAKRWWNVHEPEEDRYADRGYRDSSIAPVFPEVPRHELQLDEGQSMRFLWPFSRSGDQEQVRYALFPRSEDHPPEHGGLLWLMTAAQQPPFSVDEQRLADAVAVAGISAASRGRRRAVLLVLSETPTDRSRFDPATVRRYLSRLGVPLFVWSAGEVSDRVEAAWGEVRSVRRQSWFRSALRDLSRSLERQRIVWVEGLHLPQEIALRGDGDDVRLIR